MGGEPTVRPSRRTLGSQVPPGFKSFLFNKIPDAVPSQLEEDHIIRRALAIWRLCWHDVPNGFELIDQRLQETIGENWQKSYEKRMGEEIRY